MSPLNKAFYANNIKVYLYRSIRAVNKTGGLRLLHPLYSVYSVKKNLLSLSFDRDTVRFIIVNLDTLLFFVKAGKIVTCEEDK